MNRKVVAAGLAAVVLVVAGTGVVLDGSAAAADRETPFAFREVADERGFGYATARAFTGNANAGVYVSDYDRDGWPDLLALGDPGPALFENVGGEFRRAGVLPDLEARITGALFLDYDGDGREELLLLPLPGSAPDAARPDDRPLLFGDASEGFAYAGAANATLSGFPIGATAADADGDGVLDVFVIQSGRWSDRTPVGFRNPDSVGSITDDNGAPNLLLGGTGTGFENATAGSGVDGRRWSLATSFLDLTGDGHPDVHVANDFNEDVLYVNRGDGTFRAVRMGEVTDRNQMASEIGDVDGDGRPDVFTTNIFSRSTPDAGGDRTLGNRDRNQYRQSDRAEGNNLLINRGNGSFVDRAAAYGVRGGTEFWGWAAVLGDLDNDGDLDLVHASNREVSGGGRVGAAEPTYPLAWEFADGRFRRLDAARLGFGRQDGRGLAALDFDRDGDLDLAVANNGGPYRLYENRGAETAGGLLGGGLFGGADAHSLSILVRGSDTYLAHGATVSVTAGETTRYRFVASDAGYLSQESRVLHVGLGDRAVADRVQITWNDGTTATLTDVAADRYLVVHPNGTVTEPASHR
jgi:hypothetical protein